MNFQFESFSDFIAMGGHAPYVWFSFAIVFFTMLFFGFRPNWQFRQFVAQQQRVQKQLQQQARSAASKHSNADATTGR